MDDESPPLLMDGRGKSETTVSSASVFFRLDSGSQVHSGKSDRLGALGGMKLWVLRQGAQ